MITGAGLPWQGVRGLMRRIPAPRPDVGDGWRTQGIDTIAKLVHTVMGSGAQMLITAEVRREPFSPFENRRIAPVLWPRA